MHHPLAAVVLLVLHFIPTSHAFFPRSFQFDWKPPALPNRIPVTVQCETLHITWERCATCTGPDPKSPYFLQMYTSLAARPLVLPAGDGVTNEFNLTIPFPPNTLYQACMVDSAGNSGGCLDQYAVIPSSDVASCTNITFPSQYRQLDVQMVNAGSNMSTNGFPAQCSDIDFIVNNGQPPYTLTISPSLHPPLNITSKTPKLKWQVSLSWGTNFWVSMSDSKGFTWTAGPLHSGEGETGCLALEKVYTSHQVAGIAVGSLLSGAVAALAACAALFMFRRRRDKLRPLLTSFVRVNSTPHPTATPTTVATTRSPTTPVIDLTRSLPAVPPPLARRSTTQTFYLSETTQTPADGNRLTAIGANRPAPVTVLTVHVPESFGPPPGYTTGYTKAG